MGENRVLHLDGSPSYALIPYSNDYRPTDQITVELWFKLSEPITMDQCFRLISTAHSGGWGIGYNNLNWLQYNNGRIRFTTDVNGSYVLAQMDSILTQNLPSQTWIHIAGTYDTQYVRLYVNGELIEEVAAAGFIEYTYANSMLFGADAGPGSNPDTFLEYFFNGNLDEIRIWTRALAQSEIIKSMYRVLAGDEEELVGYWNFDDGEVTDLTEYENDGELVNNAEIIIDDSLDFCGLAGDINENEELDVLDLLLIGNAILIQNTEDLIQCHDMDVDGNMNVIDILIIVAIILN